MIEKRRNVSSRQLSRRAFLRGTGAALSLPLLDVMRPTVALAERAAPAPKRMLAICNNLGVLPEMFFPKESGRGYGFSPYLEILDDHRDQFTVFSGVSHPDVTGGHPADICFLTAAPQPGRSGFRNTISLDQFIAEQVGHKTRFPSLTLGVNVVQGERSLSWTRSGVMIPSHEKPSDVFKLLFVQGSKREVDAQVRKLALGQSILDAVSEQAKSLKSSVSHRDRERLDQYFTSVRELERRMRMSQGWERKPKPKPRGEMPDDSAAPREFMVKTHLMLDMARLALETDSTRSIAIMLDGLASPAIEFDDVKTSDGYHNLSHHAKSEKKIAELKEIDFAQMRLLDNLLSELKNVTEGDGTLLDHTMMLYGSNLGDADKHTTDNLPVLLAGGGFRHGQHLKFDLQRNYPLPNLFVSMLQNMGIEADKFATSTGTMRGLA